MILTAVHAQFWRSRQAAPKWLGKIERPQSRPSIHACINAHAGLKVAREELDVHNTISLLLMVRKREKLLPYLLKVAKEPGTIIRPDRRRALCLKWAARLIIQQERAFKAWLEAIDKELQLLLGLGLAAFPDEPYREWFESGLSAADAAELAIMREQARII